MKVKVDPAAARLKNWLMLATTVVIVGAGIWQLVQSNWTVGLILLVIVEPTAFFLVDVGTGTIRAALIGIVWLVNWPLRRFRPAGAGMRGAGPRNEQPAASGPGRMGTRTGRRPSAGGVALTGTGREV